MFTTQAKEESTQTSFKPPQPLTGYQVTNNDHLNKKERADCNGTYIIKVLSAVSSCAEFYISEKNTYTKQPACEEIRHNEKSEVWKASKADVHGIQETEQSEMK